jgi:predicted SAM-dependent methyltransferase
MGGLRLNLGCGMKRVEGFVNVDTHGEPDVRHDLEAVPWPWPDDSVGEILLTHVLEHLGRETKVYLNIMKELYRVCHDGAAIRIVVPHHRHESFFNDPTHVRVVTAPAMTLFSQRLNRQWIAEGLACTPLGIYLGIDFELSDVFVRPSETWDRMRAELGMDDKALHVQAAICNNLIEDVFMTLWAVKPPGRETQYAPGSRGDWPQLIRSGSTPKFAAASTAN